MCGTDDALFVADNALFVADIVDEDIVDASDNDSVSAFDEVLVDEVLVGVHSDIILCFVAVDGANLLILGCIEEGVSGGVTTIDGFK